MRKPKSLDIKTRMIIEDLVEKGKKIIHLIGKNNMSSEQLDFSQSLKKAQTFLTSGEF